MTHNTILARMPPKTEIKTKAKTKSEIKTTKQTKTNTKTQSRTKYLLLDLNIRYGNFELISINRVFF